MEGRPAYLLVGGSPQPSSTGLVRRLAAEAERTIAVDRGAEVLQSAGVEPWAFVGDADSVAEGAFEWATGAARVVRLHPVLKDATDLTLAFELIEETGCAIRHDAEAAVGCLVTCVSGGRLDHQLGVVGTLAAAHRLAPVLVEDGYLGWVLSPRCAPEHVFGEESVGRTVSVLAVSQGVRVSEEGMRWELDRRPLAILDDLGVSNVVERAGARIACHDGIALVIENRPFL